MPQAIHETKDFTTGQVTQTVIPWTADNLRAEIAYLRWQRSCLGITVGDLFISTIENEQYDQPKTWDKLFLQAINRPTIDEFEYKNPGAANMVLTRNQVLRIADCLSWFIAMCFRTERLLQGMINNGDDLETIRAAAINDQNWPQREFSWTPPS
jgi:hypothetical protein